MTRFFVAPLALAAACLFTMAGAHAAKPIRFHITDLGPMTEATAVSARGLAVGWANGHAGAFDGTGAVTDLGTLGGSSSEAAGVNAGGKIVGDSATPTSWAHAFVYSMSTHEMVDLGTLSTSPTATSSAGGINKSGQIVGGSDTDNFETHAFIYQNGKMRDLGTYPGHARTSLSAINTAGHAVGDAGGDGTERAILYRDGKMIDLDPTGSPTDSCWAAGINDADQIVGQCGPNFQPGFAFVYENGRMKSLGVVRPTDYLSVATAINSSGVVVGFSQGHSQVFPGSDDSVAFVYNGKALYDLNTLLDDAGSPWSLQRADDINDKGEIVGLGFVGTVLHGFLAVPVKQ